MKLFIYVHEIYTRQPYWIIVWLALLALYSFLNIKTYYLQITFLILYLFFNNSNIMLLIQWFCLIVLAITTSMILNIDLKILSIFTLLWISMKRLLVFLIKYVTGFSKKMCVCERESMCVMTHINYLSFLIFLRVFNYDCMWNFSKDLF